MEYQRKKKQILANVEYSSLLSFTLVENKLERNFKSIVEALLIAQTQGTQLKEDLQSLAKSSTREFMAMNDKMNALEKKMQQLQNRQGNDIEKSSLKKVSQQEENGFQKKSDHYLISSPKLNINLVPTPTTTQEHIPSAKEVKEIQIIKEIYKDNENEKELLKNYEELRDKINKLMQDRIDPSQLDKKLSAMKDGINLVKAEMKAMADRQAKSTKRASFISAEKIQALQAPSVKQISQKVVSGDAPTPSNQANDAQYLNAINGIQEELEREINNLHIQINTMKLNIEELKEYGSDNRRKENKLNIQVQELAKNQKKLDERLQSSNESFQSQIKELRMEILNIQTKPQGQTDLGASKKSRKNIELKQAKDASKENTSPNANQQINDRISKLQAAIQGLVTEAEFKRFKTEMKDKLSSLESEDENIRKELKEEVQMLTQILDSKEVQLAAIQKDIDQIKEKLNDMSSQCERKNNIGISRCEELKKNLQNLREDLEFYKSMNQTSSVEPKISIQPICDTGDDENKHHSGEDTSKSAEELKKYVNRKLHDQRTYLLGLIRDLEKKSGNKNNLEQDFVGLWDKLAEINLFLNKKANEDDVKKSLSFLQKKLTNLYQRITSADENNQDARIAKTNWFCLSCDKNLHNYQGKVGQHVVWDSMPIKPGYTKYYNKDKEEKKSLPTLKR